MSEASVYFVQVGDEGPVKIGVTSNPDKRLSQLQTANYEDLNLRVVIGGDPSVEARYHALFEPERIRGEWFAPTPDLLAEIAWLQDGYAPSFDTKYGPNRHRI
jgi:hypothetical protein